VEDMVERQCYVRVLIVLEEIRAGILELVGDENLEDYLDIEFIGQRMQMDSYSFKDGVSLCRGILNIVKRIQSSGREAETNEKWAELEVDILAMMNGGSVLQQANVIGKCLLFLLGRTYVIRTDASNARIRMIMPLILNSRVTYERDKFEDMLNAGTQTVTIVKEWLGHTLKLFPVFSQQISDGSQIAGLEVHAAAIVSLITLQESLNAFTNDGVPETLVRLDGLRLEFLKKEMMDLICIKAAGIIVMGVTKDAKLAENVMMMPDAAAMVEELPKNVEPYILEILKPTNCIRVVLQERVEVFLRQQIVHNHHGEDVMMMYGSTMMV
jgi:hypothetical protein